MEERRLSPVFTLGIQVDVLPPRFSLDILRQVSEIKRYYSLA